MDCRSGILLLLIGAISLAAPAFATQENSNDLQRYLPDEQQILDKENLLALHLPQNARQPKGHALLLPDWGRSPASGVINVLRNHLTDIGFDTYSLLPPTPVLPLSPLDDNNPYLQLLQPQIEQLNASLTSTMGFHLHIAQGSNACHMSSLYLNDALPQPDALVLLNAYFPDPKGSSDCSKQLAQLPFPVLDLTLNPLNRWQKLGADLRHQEMRRQLKLDYRQQQFLLDPDTMTQFTAIYGWLTSLGWY